MKEKIEEKYKKSRPITEYSVGGRAFGVTTDENNIGERTFGIIQTPPTKIEDKERENLDQVALTALMAGTEQFM